jgi:O-antigen/teichoic acid export membrane protein
MRMNISRRIAVGGAAIWLNRGLTIALGLVLMPVLFRRLPKEELGLWLLLGQSWATLGILDFGIGTALSRRIALAKGRSGSDPGCPLNEESKEAIAELVACGRRMYRVLAACVFVLAWSLGFVYLRHLELQTVGYATVWTAWTIVCATQALNVWSTVWICLLEGVGYVGWESLIATVVSTATLIAQIVVILLGGGLVGLASVATIGAVFQRLFMRALARNRHPELFAMKARWNPATARSMMELALRAWVTTLGIVLVQNTDSFFIAAGLGAASIPAFRAAFLIVLNVHTLAGVFGSVSAPYISHLWQAGDLGEVRRVVRRNLRIGLSIVLTGVATIVAAGDSLFNAWLGPGHYAGWQLPALFCLMFFFEQQIFLIMTACRATGHEAFAGWTAAGGLLKLLLAYIMTRRFGLIGIPVATLVAQCATSYWYVPYAGFRRLGIGLRTYLTEILAPCIATFVIALMLAALISRAAVPLGDWSRLVLIASTSGLVLIAACWFLVLEPGQRHRVAMRLGYLRPSAISAE